jgi:hypothetical protein
MCKRTDNYNVSSSIPKIEVLEQNTYTAEPIPDTSNSECIQWLRVGLVCHIDLITFETIPPETKRDRRKYQPLDEGKADEIFRIYRKIYKDTKKSAGNNKKHFSNIKWNRIHKEQKPVNPFKRFTKIEYGNVKIVILLDRHKKYGGRWKADGTICIGWKRKEDYTGYSEHVLELERILAVVGLRCRIYRAEIAMDTTSRSVWNYVFNHTLVRAGASDEIMYWDYKANRGKGRVKGGLIPGATDIYQNNLWNKRQLLNHVKNKVGSYFDHEMNSHILRSEIRVNNDVIQQYGPYGVNTVLTHMEQIYQGEVLWKQIRPSKIRELKNYLSEEDERTIALNPIVYWVWTLSKLEISMGDARDAYCISLDPKRAKRVL